jgi:phenylacetate-CoA ligase
MSAPGHPDRATLTANQLAALRRLLGELVPGNRFYFTKLAASAGVSDLSDWSDLSDLQAFRDRIHFTLKEEVVADQAAHPPFGTNLTYSLDYYTRYSQTSGTTGQPLRWLDTPESWSWMVDNWARLLRVTGIGAADRIFFAFSFGPFFGFWTAFEAGQRIGALCVPGGGMSSAARLRTMLDTGATALCCTPTYALRLADVAREEGLDFQGSDVRTLMVAGEPGGSLPAVRARIEAAWPGAVVRDHHGMTEVGPVTYECSARPCVLHVMENAFYPEVIDPQTGAPAAPGERGELVLTNLGRLGSPLLRYRTGDLVQPGGDGPCECGTYEMALEGGILGRTDDMLVLRGVNLHPSAFEDVLRRFPEIVEYRVEVRSVGAMGEVAVSVEPAPGSDPQTLCRSVEGALRAAFNLRVPVSAVEPGSLPRFEMKARRWVRS